MDEKKLQDSLLYRKILGSLCAAAVGDAMGGPVEGMDWFDIEEKHGHIVEILDYDKKPERVGTIHGPWKSHAGTVTDDTRFRHILARSIIDHMDQYTRGDFIETIAAYYFKADQEIKAAFMEEYVLKAFHGDRMKVWGGQPVSASLMMNSPFGLIHPGDPIRAYEDTFAISFLSEGYAQTAAGIAAAAVAAAMTPSITVEEIVEAAVNTAARMRIQGNHFKNWEYGVNVGQPVERLIDIAIHLAKKTPDVFKLREHYYRELTYLPIMVDAAQAIAVALGMLVAARGDLKLTIIGTVNYGRDCDTYASVAGAIVGALQGVEAIPNNWFETIRRANPDEDFEGTAMGLANLVIQRYRNRKSILKIESTLLSQYDLVN